jgi:hypothetical protein
MLPNINNRSTTKEKKESFSIIIATQESSIEDRDQEMAKRIKIPQACKKPRRRKQKLCIPRVLLLPLL